jgi:hypothetical protein
MKGTIRACVDTRDGYSVHEVSTLCLVIFFTTSVSIDSEVKEGPSCPGSRRPEKIRHFKLVASLCLRCLHSTPHNFKLLFVLRLQPGLRAERCDCGHRAALQEVTYGLLRPTLRSGCAGRGGSIAPRPAFMRLTVIPLLLMVGSFGATRHFDFRT